MYSMLEYIPYIMVGASTVLTSSPILFLVFLFINDRLNKLLKSTIKQSRPKDCAPYMRKSYGMPSAHTQNASFAAAFVWNEVTRTQQMILALLTLATMAQRVYTYCHTIPQVLVGLGVGTFLGVLSYYIVVAMKRQREKHMFM